MKRALLFASLLLAPLLAEAQLKPPEALSEVELATLTRNFIFGVPQISYDQVARERVVYSGVSIQLFRAPNPLQLLNPWAPKEYGPSDQNLALDPVTERPAGIKFFAIRF